MAFKIINKHFLQIIDQINIYNRHSNRILFKLFESKYEKNLWMIFLYLSQIELFKNIRSLLFNSNPIAIPILVRSSIDILVLMRICNKDFQKLKSFYKHQVKKEIKYFIEYIKTNDLKKLDNNILIIILNLINNYQTKNDELKEVKKNNLTEKRKRDLSEIDDKLEKLYNKLSDHVHHGFDTLVGRHGIINANQYRASNSKKINKIYLFTCIHGLLLSLKLSIVELFTCVGLPGNHNLNEINNKINKLDRILLKNMNATYN